MGQAGSASLSIQLTSWIDTSVMPGQNSKGCSCFSLEETVFICSARMPSQEKICLSLQDSRSRGHNLLPHPVYTRAPLRAPCFLLICKPRCQNTIGCLNYVAWASPGAAPFASVALCKSWWTRGEQKLPLPDLGMTLESFAASCAAILKGENFGCGMRGP